MKNKGLIVLFLLLMQGCTSQSKKINGLSFVAAPQKIDTSNISSVKNVKANYVALMPFGFIKDLNSSEIIFNTKRQWFGETSKGILQYGKEFKKANIKLMVKPQIWVWKGAFTGRIFMNSEHEWNALEKSYEKFIITYAKDAQTLNAQIFCIGTELEFFVKNRPDFWKKLIVKIKKVYKGELTYAANWDEFKRVPFWNQLDYIGIDAYFPLSNKKEPSIKDLEQGWQPHKKAILEVQSKYDVPVLFTEFGYRSVNYTAREPWQSNIGLDSVNLENQTKTLQVIYNQFWKEKWFSGGFVWKWFVEHAKSGGKKDNMFTPQNKPAERMIKKIYGEK